MKQVYYDFSSSVEVEPCIAVKNIKETPDSLVFKQTTNCLELTFLYENHPPVNVTINQSAANEILEKLKSACAIN